jgi:ATP-binding cassette subfamily B protein
MGTLDAHKRGDILSRITNDVDSLQTGITSTFLQFMTAVITLVGVVIMMLSINIWMTLIALVLIPLSFMIISQVVKRSQKYYKLQLKYKGSVNTQIEETFTGQDIIRAYNYQERSFNYFKQDNDKWYEHEWKSQFYSSLMGPIMNFVSNLSYIAIAVIGAVFVLQGVIVVGDIMAFFQYIQNFTQPIQQITRVMNLLQTALAACERIFEFLELDIEENNSNKKITDIKSDITFDNVSFSYDDKKVIDNLSFKANKGQKVAIVGHTGAGSEAKYYIWKNGEPFYTTNKSLAPHCMSVKE